MTAKIRVLVVDDSAFARKVLREMLNSHPHVEVVGAARDGEEALQLAAELRPDIVLCDLLMPRLDGVGFVRKQMALRPLPILIVSAAEENAEAVIEALAAGAIDVVRKPTALATDDLRAIRDDLIAVVEMAMRVPMANVGREFVAPRPMGGFPTPRRTGNVDMVVIGISTGGPQALRKMMPLFPADFPVPIAMVLHMPVGYTALYAEKLDEICALEVAEAKDGDVLRPGLALLAPAGRHLVFRRQGSDVVAQLTVQPLEKAHRPSADVLFQSVAEIFGERVLAVVMTGMGDDGKEGSAWVKARGGVVLTEAEESCVIYGMPRSVVEAGLSDLAVPLEGMAQAITSHL